MNIEMWKLIFQVVQALGTLGVGIYVWWTNREKVTNARFSGHDKRLTALENTISTLSKAEAMTELKQTVNQALADFKNSMTKTIADLRVEFDRRETCGNHQRMEKNDTELFQTLRTLHGDLQKVIGGIESMKESMKEQISLLMEHHLNGGK